MASDAEFLSGEDEGEPSDAEAFSFQDVPKSQVDGTQSQVSAGPLPSDPGIAAGTRLDMSQASIASRHDEQDAPASADASRRTLDAPPSAPTQAHNASHHSLVASVRSAAAASVNASAAAAAVQTDGVNSNDVANASGAIASDAQDAVSVSVMSDAVRSGVGEEGAQADGSALQLPAVDELAGSMPSVAQHEAQLAPRTLSRVGPTLMGSEDGTLRAGDDSLASDMHGGLVVPPTAAPQARKQKQERASVSNRPPIAHIAERIFFQASRGRKLASVGDLARLFVADADIQNLYHSTTLSDEEGNLLLYLETLSVADRTLVTWEDFANNLHYVYSDREGVASKDGDVTADEFSSSTGSVTSPPRPLVAVPPAAVRRTSPSGGGEPARTASTNGNGPQSRRASGSASRQQATAFALHPNATRGRQGRRTCQPGTPPFHDPSHVMRSTSASRAREVENAHATYAARGRTASPGGVQARAGPPMTFGIQQGVLPGIGGAQAHADPALQVTPRQQRSGSQKVTTPRSGRVSERARVAQHDAQRRAAMNHHLHRGTPPGRQRTPPRSAQKRAQQQQQQATHTPIDASPHRRDGPWRELTDVSRAQLAKGGPAVDAAVEAAAVEALERAISRSHSAEGVHAAGASSPGQDSQHRPNLSATAVEMALSDLRELLPHEAAGGGSGGGGSATPSARYGVLLSPDPQGRASHRPGGQSDTDTLLDILRERLSPQKPPEVVSVSPQRDTPQQDASTTEILCLQTFISQQRDIIKALETRLAESEEEFRKSVKRERRAQRRERETLQQKETLETKLLQMSDPKRLRRVLQKHDEQDPRVAYATASSSNNTPGEMSPRRRPGSPARRRTMRTSVTSPIAFSKPAAAVAEVQTDGDLPAPEGWLPRADVDQLLADAVRAEREDAARERASAADAHRAELEDLKAALAAARGEARAATAKVDDVTRARDATIADNEAFRRKVADAEADFRRIKTQIERLAQERDDALAGADHARALLQQAEKTHKGISGDKCNVCGGNRNLQLRSSGWKCKDCVGKKHKKK